MQWKNIGREIVFVNEQFKKNPCKIGKNKVK